MIRKHVLSVLFLVLVSPGTSASFTGSVQTYSTTMDGNGLFNMEGMPSTGTFVINAVDDSGAVGSAQGSLLPSDSDVSVLVVVDQPGSGVIQGHVSSQQSQQGGEVLVTAIFPDTQREHVTVTDIDGNYRLDGRRLDVTVIVIAFDNGSGSSTSCSTALTSNDPVRTVDLELITPAVINSELTNGNFSDGLTGWTHSGPLELVDRNLVFGIQN